MAISIEVDYQEVVSKKYPWIGEHSSSGRVLLFIDESSALVILEGTAKGRGHVARIPSYREKEYSLYLQPITLWNK